MKNVNKDGSLGSVLLVVLNSQRSQAQGRNTFLQVDKKEQSQNKNAHKHAHTHRNSSEVCSPGTHLTTVYGFTATRSEA